MYVKYINLRRCREEDHLNYDWSSNNYHLNCFLEISPGRPIRLLLWSTGHINQCPNVFLSSISGFIFFPSVRSSHYSKITSGRNSTRVPLKKKFGYCNSFFLCMINSTSSPALLERWRLSKPLWKVLQGMMDIWTVRESSCSKSTQDAHCELRNPKTQVPW